MPNHEAKSSADLSTKVVIADYGLGNLFSVRQALLHAGCNAEVSSDPDIVQNADALVLPGVGAFADAMKMLQESGLARALERYLSQDKPLLAICLGMQLLFEKSEEFGSHAGFGYLAGEVVRFPHEDRLKVPHIGWNQIHAPTNRSWEETALQKLEPGSYVYFVHSFYCMPTDHQLAIAMTTYGDVEFTSCLRAGSVLACQFHPERSGADGLKIYEAFVQGITT